MVNDVVSGVSGLRVGDCVVAVDGRPLEELVRNGPVRNYEVGDVIRYDVRRSDASLDRDCSGSLASVEVTLTPYRFGSVLRENASVLLLAGFMLALGAFLVAVRPRSGVPGALLVAACFYLFGLTARPFGIQVVDLASGPRLWPFVIGDTAKALFWGALLLMAASLPRQSLPPRRLVIGCFVVPLALHLLYIPIALQQTSELGKLARLVSVSFGAAHAIPILMVLALVLGYQVSGTAGETGCCAMGSDSLYALDVRLSRARETARHDHRASLDPMDLVPRTFHPGPSCNDRGRGA